MATGPRIDKWLTLVINGLTGSEKWANVLAYKTFADIGSTIDLATIANDFVSVVLPTLLNAMSNTSSVTSIFLRTNYPNTTNYEYELPLTPPQPGVIVQDAAPQNAAPVISWRSTAVGRSFRGRSYIGGLADGSATNSVLTSGYLQLLAAVATAIATYTGPLPANAMTFVVASRKLLTLIPIVSAIIDLYSRSQRDRLPGERRHKKKRTPTG